MSETRRGLRTISFLLAAGLGASACSGGQHPTSEDRSPVKQSISESTGSSSASYPSSTESQGAPSSSDCDPYVVYAQNRWAPLGASERAQPDALAAKIASYAGNEIIAIDGWIDTDIPVYPTNTPPWNSGIWLHEKNIGGWVSFAGVRGEPVSPDPTGQADGGQPAPTPPECELEYDSN